MPLTLSTSLVVLEAWPPAQVPVGAAGHWRKSAQSRFWPDEQSLLPAHSGGQRLPTHGHRRHSCGRPRVGRVTLHSSPKQRGLPAATTCFRAAIKADEIDLQGLRVSHFAAAGGAS